LTGLSLEKSLSKSLAEQTPTFHGVAVILLALNFLDLNNRIGELYTLTNQRSVMRTQVEMLQSTEKALRKQIAYATSDISC
jgi:hypothetical protein